MGRFKILSLQILSFYFIFSKKKKMMNPLF